MMRRRMVQKMLVSLGATDVAILIEVDDASTPGLQQPDVAEESVVAILIEVDDASTLLHETGGRYKVYNSMLSQSLLRWMLRRIGARGGHYPGSVRQAAILIEMDDASTQS